MLNSLNSHEELEEREWGPVMTSDSQHFFDVAILAISESWDTRGHMMRLFSALSSGNFSHSYGTLPLIVDLPMKHGDFT